MTVVINTTWAEWARAGRRKMCSTWEKVQNSGCKHLDDPVGICRTTSPNPIIWHSLLNVNYKFDLTGHYLQRPNNKYIYGTVRDGRKSHCAVRPGLRSWISGFWEGVVYRPVWGQLSWDIEVNRFQIIGVYMFVPMPAVRNLGPIPWSCCLCQCN